MLRCTGHAAWSRYLKASVALFWGRCGLPLPYKHDIISLVGPPLPGQELKTAAVPDILGMPQSKAVLQLAGG
jgi:hypothetical protein